MKCFFSLLIFTVTISGGTANSQNGEQSQMTQFHHVPIAIGHAPKETRRNVVRDI